MLRLLSNPAFTTKGSPLTFEEGDQTFIDLYNDTQTKVSKTGGDILTGDYQIIGNVTISGTSFFKLPVGTTVQRPATPAPGQVRFNSETFEYEGFYPNGSVWKSLGGSGGGSTGGVIGNVVNQVFFENEQHITADYTITVGKNAMTAGPVTIDDNVTVTIPDGSFWTIV